MHLAAGLNTHEWPSAASHQRPEAPLALLVHGVTGWHRTWWRVGPALAQRGWRVVAVDQRGHGHSPRIDGHITVGQLAADLAATIEALGAPADAVIGHSLGAAVSAELAYLRPDLMRRVVLEDPPSMTRARDRIWQAKLEREIHQAQADFAGEVARELTENPTWEHEDARQDVEGRQLADREGLLATFRRDTGARVLQLAPLLSVPALYLLADEGRSAFRGDARARLATALPPNARLVSMDSGHTIHRDRFEAYLATLLEWMGA